MGGVKDGIPTEFVSGKNCDSEEIVPLRLDADTRSLRISNWVWNSVTLAWERMKQPTLEVGDLTVTMADVEKLLAGAYWLRTKYDYDVNDDCIYKGLNTDMSAADGDTDWYIVKYTYVGGNCTEKRVRVTSWTERASGW